MKEIVYSKQQEDCWIISYEDLDNGFRLNEIWFDREYLKNCKSRQEFEEIKERAALENL